MKLSIFSLIFGLTLSFHLFASDKLRLVVDTKSLENLTTSEVLTLDQILGEVEEILPHSFKEKLNRDILVKVKKLNEQSLDLEKICQGKVLGRTQNSFFQTTNMFEIDPVILLGFKAKNNIICNNKTLKELALGVVIHEIAHLYDYQEKVSKRPYFRTITDWSQKGFILKRNYNKNKNIKKSFDAYEFKNPKETFAVNFEFYLQNEKFSCERPVLNEFFNKEFIESRRNPNCSDEYKVSIIKSFLKKDFIDIKRLYSIDYLFAGKSSRMGSNWGHSLVRLVFCAPNVEMGENCREDQEYHIVGSFAAQVNDFSLSFFKGIFGGYKSSLNFLSFHEIKRRYTKEEYRELISFPMKLDQVQKERLFKRLMERYYLYFSDYRFISNNCADETLDVFKVILPENKSYQKESVLTPLGLKNILVEYDVIDDEEAGEYFPSAKDSLQKIYEDFMIGTVKKDYKDSLEFARFSSPLRREYLYKSNFNRFNLDKSFVAKMLQFELHVKSMLIKDKNMSFNRQVQRFVADNPEHPMTKKILDYINGFRGTQKELVEEIKSKLPIDLKWFDKELELIKLNTTLLENKIEELILNQFSNL